MRPWQHSVASSIQLRQVSDPRGNWSAFLPLHEFLDLSKVGCADRRHRIMLHHCDLGAEIAAMAFPDVTDCARLVAQHVQEDLGYEAVLADWIEQLDVADMPKPVARRVNEGPEGIALLVASRLVERHPRSAAAAVEQKAAALRVARFLFAPLDHAPGAPAEVLGVLMNCVGPALVRRVFGPPLISFNGDQRVVIDWGWIAEATIMASFGRIPDLSEIARSISEHQTTRSPRALSA